MPSGRRTLVCVGSGNLALDGGLYLTTGMDNFMEVSSGIKSRWMQSWIQLEKWVCSGDATVRLFLQSCCCLLIKWCCEFHMKSECSVSPRDRRWRRSIEARWRLTKMSQCICWHDLIRTVTVIDYHLSTAAAVVRGIINGRHGASNPRHAEKRGRKSIKTQAPRLIRPV